MVESFATQPEVRYRPLPRTALEAEANLFIQGNSERITDAEPQSSSIEGTLPAPDHLFGEIRLQTEGMRNLAS